MSVAKNWREMPRRYRLEAGQCKNCGQVYFPPRLICAKCGSREFSVRKLQRRGTLLTYTIIHVGPSQFVDQTPYAVGIVEMQDGVRLLCQVTDCNLSELKTGIPVKIEFRRVSEEGEAGIINYGYKCVPA